MTCWIEKRPTIKKGVFITLKNEPKIEWKIVDTYSECDSEIIHSDWEVGGLGKRNH